MISTAQLNQLLRDEEQTIAAYSGQVTTDPPLVHAVIRAGLIKELMALANRCKEVPVVVVERIAV